MSAIKAAIQQTFVLTEDASAELEAMLAREVCPQHQRVLELDGGTCLHCDLDEAQHRANKPVWVRRAEARLLPPKVIQ